MSEITLYPKYDFWVDHVNSPGWGEEISWQQTPPPLTVGSGDGTDNPALLDPIFMKFDFSSVPTDRQLEQAVLYMFLLDPDEEPDRPTAVTLYQVTEDVDWETITWVHQPECASDPFASMPIPYPFKWSSSHPDDHDNQKWYSVDITSMVRDWIGGTVPNYGMRLHYKDYGYYNMLNFGCSWGGTECGPAPYLLLTFADPEQQKEVDSMGYTHFDKVSGINGIAVGEAGSEVALFNGSGAASLPEQFVKGQKFFVHIPFFAASDAAKPFWVAPAACKILSATEVHGTAATSADTLQITKLASGKAPGDASEADLLATAFALNSTANTPVTKAAVTTSAATFAAGDRLCSKLAGTGTGYAGGSIVVTMVWA